MPPVKVTRKKKETHINWISCNSYKNWVHPRCPGLNKKKYRNWKTFEGKENRSLFQVIKCCSKSIITSGIQQTEELPSLLPNIHRTRFHQDVMLSSIITPTKTKVQFRKFGQQQHQRNVKHKKTSWKDVRTY